MRIGVNTFIRAAAFGRPQLDLLPSLEDAGFDGVEIPVFEPASFSAAEVRRVRDAVGLASTVGSIAFHANIEERFIERFGPNLGALSAAVAIRRDIEPDVDAVAFDGPAFLRKARDS